MCLKEAGTLSSGSGSGFEGTADNLQNWFSCNKRMINPDAQVVEQGGKQTGPVTCQGSFSRSQQYPGRQVSRRPQMADFSRKFLPGFLSQNPKQQE